MGRDYTLSYAAEMIRCDCGSKYIIKRLPDRMTSEIGNAYFDWFSGKQVGSTCPICKASLYERWAKLASESIT